MRKIIQLGSAQAKYYNNIIMKAHPELHSEVADVIKKYVHKNSDIIDFGSGEGAFALRLSDLGYNVIAVDQNEKDYKGTNIPFHAVNFNNPSLVQRFVDEHANRYDAVLGIEVIEHLENPWEFVRTLKRLTKRGGYIFITTPNVKSWLSRLNFLLTGKMYHFSKEDIYSSGHINPITDMELRNIATENKLVVKEIREICKLPYIWIARNKVVMAYSALNLILSPLMGSTNQGDILLMICEKKDDIT
jgi:2-polyprenyl-3-methyl-5-hydroxy-6-metoxy-1,4-benzoquinol methylase